MVNNFEDLLSHVGERDAGFVLFFRVTSIVLFIQSIFGLWSSNQGRSRTIGHVGFGDRMSKLIYTIGEGLVSHVMLMEE